MLKKFNNPYKTSDNKKRASVKPQRLKTLWINTGTLCNLECVNCYIESSPKNDRLQYFEPDDLKVYLDEIKEKKFGTQEIGFTGGEPFMNPKMMEMIQLCLELDFEVLVLSNAMKPMQKQKERLLALRERYAKRLKIRVSLDHYSQEKHEQERGSKTWAPALAGIQWLDQNQFNLSIAGRTLWNENELEVRHGFRDLFMQLELNLDIDSKEHFILFPEMDASVDVPEITTECWDILNKKPNDMMCASSRMVIKRKGASSPVVVACTLLPYEKEFELGPSLQTSMQRIYLNHPHCAKFCVLGGGSCGQS